MPIEIADDAVRSLYSAAAVLLVERHFVPFVPASFAAEFTVIAFAGDRIGDAAGTAAPLASIGLPAAPLFVVEQTGSGMATALLEFAKAAKFPQPIAVCRLPRPGGMFGGSATKKLERFIEQSALAVLRRVAAAANRRELEVQALRQQVADQNGQLARLRDGLALAGIADAQFSLPLGARPLVERDGRTTALAPLYGVEAIRVRATSPDTGRVRLVFTLNGREVDSRTLEFGGASPTLDLPVPAELTNLRDSVEISLQALDAGGAPVGPGAFGSVLFRLAGSGAPAPSPASTTQRLGPAAKRTGDEAPIVAAGVFLEAGSTVRLAGKLQGYRKRPAIDLTLAPHGAAGATALVLATDSAAGTDFTLEGTVAATGRYDVAARTRPTSPLESIAWLPPELVRAEAATPVAFASARFASLANAISFCDGTAEETRINAAQGFATIAVADGTGYLQTHPIVGRVAGARLPRLIPYGTTSIWIDIENARATAAPFEFFAVISPTVRQEPIDEWMGSLQLPEYRGVSIIERPDVFVARTVLTGGTSFVFRLGLSAPLPHDGTLYCLVRPTTADASYGWCRWHRIVVGLPASERLGA